MIATVWASRRVCGHEHNMPVAHAALGDDVVGKRLHLGTASLEHANFDTTIVADVNVQCRLREVVMIVELLR